MSAARNNAGLILELAILLTTKLQELQLLFQRAQAEERDITKEEVDAARAQVDTSLSTLDEAIALKREREASEG